MRRGDRFRYEAGRIDIEVTRVARDRSWADVHCTLIYGDGGWRKRQRLVNGAFAFPVEVLP